MFGLGIWEFIIVVVVGLLVLGPRKLPNVARQIGKLIREFRRASYDLRRGLDDSIDPVELGRSHYEPPPPPPSLTELGIKNRPVADTVADENDNADDSAAPSVSTEVADRSSESDPEKDR